jgi:hypothetical protein
LLGISALPEFSPNLPECDRGEFSNAIRRQAIALIDVLAIPTAGKCLDNPRCFPTMLIKGVVELGARSIVSEPSAGTDMIAELAAEMIVKAALGQAGKKTRAPAR